MLNPLLLWFLPLALTPIVLHLITNYRARTVELSTFRFLMSSYVQQRRRIKLLEYLTMLLRTLFVLLLIFAVSRPMLSQFNLLDGAGGGRDIALIVDTSASMAAREGGMSSFERAKLTASTVLSQLQPADHVTLIDAAASPRIVASGYVGDRPAFEQPLRDMPLSAAASDLEAALGELLATQRRGPRIAYFFTDGRNDAWASLARRGEQPDWQGTRLIALDVGPREPVANVSVTGDPKQMMRPMPGLPMRWSATVVNHSNEARNVLLSLVLDDEHVQQIDVPLDAGESVVRHFDWRPDKPGLVRGRFEITRDAMPADDTWRFAINVPSQVRVLIVTAPSANGSERTSMYLRTALSSTTPAGENRPTASQLADALTIQTVEYSALTQTQLAKADVVILADAPMDDQRGILLNDYLQLGGGMLILPGPNVSADAYQRFLLYRGMKPDAARPLALQPPVGDPDDESQFLPISRVDLAHPVLHVFDEVDADHFATVRLYRRVPIALNAASDAATQVHALLSLPDQTAALAEMKLGRGTVLLAGFAATPDWSNLPLCSEFVPLILRSIAYLRCPDSATAAPVTEPGRPALVTVGERWSNATARVTDPAGVVHDVELHRDRQQYIGAWSRAMLPGYYTFGIDSHQPNAPGEWTVATAVNIDKTQSNDAPVDAARLAATLAPLEVTYLQSSPDDPALVRQLTTRREVWRYLIWAMFAVIGLEFLIVTLRPNADRKTPTTQTRIRGLLQSVGLFEVRK